MSEPHAPKNQRSSNNKMGKRKRSGKDESDIVDKVWKRVKKLVKTRKRIVSSSSSDSPRGDVSASPTHLNSYANQPAAQASNLEIQDEVPFETQLGAWHDGEDERFDKDEELDPDILELLGSDPTQDKSYGDNLHKDLATRWKHILINGLPKEEKVDLLKQYLPAENCAYMKAPLLNPEIKSALSDINVKKDSYSEQKQNQMSGVISAIGKTLNSLLTQSDNVPQEVIKMLSDAGRLLCDTHYRESISRRFAIINSISKQKREVLKNTKIDENLFCSNLSEHLKSSKAISKSASELKLNIGKSNQSRPQPSTSAHNSGTLNARGAPRAPAAETRVYPAHQYRRPPPPTTQPAPPARDRRRVPPPPATHRSRPYPQPARRR